MSIKLRQMLEQIERYGRWREQLEAKASPPDLPPPLPHWKAVEQVIRIAEAAEDIAHNRLIGETEHDNCPYCQHTPEGLRHFVFCPRLRLQKALEELEEQS